jgi:hypothetical protein
MEGVQAVEDIVFVHSVDCRACAFEIQSAPKRKLEKIIQERKRCRKCQQCVRLAEAIKTANKA